MMQKYIIDTHTLLWYLSGDNQLSQTAKELIEDRKNQIFLSVVSVWEMAIKISIGKLILPLSFQELKYRLLEDSIELLAIEMEATFILSALPFHHKDPFDRMIIAQAQNHQMPIIGKDEAFKNYNISLIW
ncbi:MAG: type II toxin-antitoxin system VapC family toxin [Microscillaceae bacterium]|nr:type II toxin-antitoxin system VapC family toxin [Microscillaceae bacterium]